jgi:uncharacterized Fe-S center protein
MSKSISRREFILGSAVVAGSLVVGGPKVLASAGEDGAPVYFTRDLSSFGLLNAYDSVMQGRQLSGKVAVKLHSGEPGGHNYPDPNLIKGLVQRVNGTIVECNTAYPGKRFKTEDHMVALKDHGFTGIAPVDVMDEHGSISLPIPDGKNIKENYVGASFANYDSFLVLSHFKGHAMGGFGGAIKNTSIGIASSEGKMWIHTAGIIKDTKDFSACFKVKQDLFLESMAEAAGSVINRLGKDNIVFVSLANNLSVDCDCNNNPAPPELENLGILASTDPVALDKACVDMIYAADPAKSAHLRERIESRNGTHTLDYAEEIGIGRKAYKLISIDV